MSRPPAMASEKWREEEEGLIHRDKMRRLSGTSSGSAGGRALSGHGGFCLQRGSGAAASSRLRLKGLAVLECFRAWTFANPKRLLSGAAAIALIIGLSIFKMLYRPPAPPSPWRAQCRPDFPTHYAFHPPNPLHPHPHPPGPGPHGPPSRPPRRTTAEVDQRQVIHSIQPMTAAHPAWPYPNGHAPTLADADRIPPVGVLVGVFTMDREAKRRQLIRSTYMVHPESRKQGTEGVKVLFVMGRPTKKYAAEIAMESELYGDILVLDIHENMNDGKTHAFFAWAAKHAHVPDCRYSAHVPRPTMMESATEVREGDAAIYERGTEERRQVICEGTKEPDYVMKADDDSFIVLSELERRLRILPREKAYWGLLMYGAYLQFAERSEYMAGEGYALSMDLVKFVAEDPYVLEHTTGDEDQRVGDWLRAHPKAEEVVWVTERCWMYDHPKARKVLSHGFLFPNVHRSIVDGSETYLPPALPYDLRKEWSTVTPYGRAYQPPSANLTIAQQIEAMVEGSPLSMLTAHNRPYFQPPRHHSERSGSWSWSGGVSEEGSVEQAVAQAWNARSSRSDRMRGGEEGGSTVLVHKVRNDAWWMETALALLGP